MSRFISLLALLSALTMSLSTTAAESEWRASLGGFLCAKPFPPDCVSRPETFRSDQKVADCQAEVDRFAAMAGAYRDCLERQISQTMRDANAFIDRFRCLAKRAACPSIPTRP